MFILNKNVLLGGSMSLFKRITGFMKSYTKTFNQFRNYFADAQLVRLFMLSIFFTLYGAWFIVFFSPIFLRGQELLLRVFGAFTIFSALSVLACLFLIKYKFKTPGKKAFFTEALLSLVAVVNLALSLFMLDFSIKLGYEMNFIMWTVAYGLMCSLFYIRVSFIIFMNLFSMGWLAHIVTHLSMDTISINLVGSMIAFAFIFLLGSIMRYNAGVNAFKGRMAAEELREALIGVNEEVNAQNAELKRVTDELRKTNEDQKIFTASMNHELRTPLNGIIGSMQVMLQDDSLSEEQRSNIERALKSGNILLEIVNNMLDFSKMEAGQFEIIEHDFDLRDIIDALTKSFEPLAEKQGLKYILNVPTDTICSLNGDATRIQQIAMNLISNAIKYTDEGSVSVSFAVLENKIRFVVADTGQGMTESAQKDLFTPYKRFNVVKNASIQGTGLGLAIVNNLINSMNGVIEIDSKLGKGSTFTVELPIKVVDSSIKWETKKDVEHIEVTSLNLIGKKILCVDDNKVNLAIFKGLLKQTEADIELVDSGKSAIEKSLQRKYDIIFMDCMMPEMDGIEAMKRIRELSSINAYTPIIALTANAGPTKEAEYREIGFEGYLPKPVIRDELLSLLAHYLDN